MFFSPSVFKSLENSSTYVQFRVHLPGQPNLVSACQIATRLARLQLT